MTIKKLSNEFYYKAIPDYLGKSNKSYNTELECVREVAEYMKMNHPNAEDGGIWIFQPFLIPLGNDYLIRASLVQLTTRDQRNVGTSRPGLSLNLHDFASWAGGARIQSTLHASGSLRKIEEVWLRSTTDMYIQDNSHMMEVSFTRLPRISNVECIQR